MATPPPPPPPPPPPAAAAAADALHTNVGILAMEVYFPSLFVDQGDLELHYCEAKGKYTIGLGQDAMAVCGGDLEDINSICLTVTKMLLEKYDISPRDIGRLEVGTETLVDKSKSTKTVLMSLFEECGNTDVEGATVVNACYGGTAALLNSLQWVESSSWDGRYAIVVAGDIAIYSDSKARATGGCGAVAMLIGRNAPIAIDLRSKVTYSSHEWDFFKPQLNSEYPRVNGELSNRCYMRALDNCYFKYRKKQQEALRHKVRNSNSNSHSHSNSNSNNISSGGGNRSASNKSEEILGAKGEKVKEEEEEESIDYFLFHSPYNKLVQKSFGRLKYIDILSGSNADATINTINSTINSKSGSGASIESRGLLQSIFIDDLSYSDKELDAYLKKISAADYEVKVAPSCLVSKKIGNAYAASVYINLACLIWNKGLLLDKSTAALFSYGSGCIASMFTIRFRSDSSLKFSLGDIQTRLDFDARLASREKICMEDYLSTLSTRERLMEIVCEPKLPFSPLMFPDKLFPGTYYLESINENFERKYTRYPLTAERRLGGDFLMELGPSLSTRSTMETLDRGLLRFIDNDRLSESRGSSHHSIDKLSDANRTTHLEVPEVYARRERSDTFVWPSGKTMSRVVVTGMAAAIPGTHSDAPGLFMSGVDNIQKIIDGQNFMSEVPSYVKDSVLDKNISLSVKSSDGKQVKKFVNSYEDSINLCASLGQINLKAYGVDESIVNTMDSSVQVAVAAGLESLRNAGIVPGGGVGTEGWVLPKSMQETTGIVYATSFPALDAAIGEVSKFFTSKLVDNLHVANIVAALRKRLFDKYGELSSEGESALVDIEKLLSDVPSNTASSSSSSSTSSSASSSAPTAYEFDRKFLFRLLVLGNAQLAQIIKAKGPNMQSNASCSGSIQAIALAYDMIQVGRAERMVVIAGDNASSDTLLPWLGSGFLALGAASTCSDPALAAIPFDARRSGLILGAGGIGMVLESEEGANRRFSAYQRRLRSTSELSNISDSSCGSASSISYNDLIHRDQPFRCRILGTLISNSAHHGSSLDRMHMANELERFISGIEKELGIERKDIANNGVYFAHETFTNASEETSCASNEINALRAVFGEDLKNLLICNTKCFTGHSMGVSFEDVVAAKVLEIGVVPPIPKEVVLDPKLGSLKLSCGGTYPCKYALRFAGGFGSQVAFALYGTIDT